MSDNIYSREIRRRLVIYLRIPNENWTDVFKLIPRRNLVRNISPACYRFKEICNRNVKYVHMITDADWFSEKLEEDEPEGKQELEHLAGHKCELADQFKLKKFWINEKSKAIIGHCLDLFEGCQITWSTQKHWAAEKIAFLNETFDILGSIKPITIRINHKCDQDMAFLLHPTLLNCISIQLTLTLSEANMETALENIFKWVHHQPVDQNDGSVAHNQHEKARCLVLCFTEEITGGLLDRCFENFRQSQCPTDRRHFVLSFQTLGANNQAEGRLGHVVNHSTGELLVLYHEPHDDDDDQPFHHYRLHRLLIATESAVDEPDFDAAHRSGDVHFSINEGASAEVSIE